MTNLSTEPTTEIDPNACHQCRQLENYDGWAAIGRMVQDCDRCGEPVCSDCAEVDYDGDSEGFRYVQWTCGPCLNPEAFRTETPSFERVRKAIKQAFVAAPYGSWESGLYYLDGLLTMDLLAVSVKRDEAASEILSKLADDLEAIDRKHGVVGYDYSNLRMPLEVV